MRMKTKLQRFFQRTIWETRMGQERTLPIRVGFGFLRFLAIVWHGITQNRMMGNAAALSFSTLIALGPLIAVVVMTSSFVFQNSEEDRVEQFLNDSLAFISTPATVQMDKKEPSTQKREQNKNPIDQEATGNSPPQKSSEPADESSKENPQINPEITRVVDQLIASARSGAVGIVGTIVLILIAIQLITTIEKSLNLIWGIQRGRTFAQRVVFYWTFLSLGMILTFAAIALLSASSMVDMAESLPFGAWFPKLIDYGAPVLSFLVIVLLLGSFYRFMPNTHVQWGAALGGALAAATLLFLNKELSFLYVSRVVRAQSLYGSIGILPVFMFGIYVFWLFILIGGQVSYAAQNMITVRSLRAWEHISQRTQESLGLAALVIIAKHFKNCQKPATIEQINKELHVPQKILNYSLENMAGAGIINPVHFGGKEDEEAVGYQPARPLEYISMGFFKRAFDTIGNDEGYHLLKSTDPLVELYRKWMDKIYSEEKTLSTSIDTWLEQKYLTVDDLPYLDDNSEAQQSPPV